MPHIVIDPAREYTPKEIMRNRLIVNTIGKQDYRYVLELIRIGRLRARNVSAGTKSKKFKVLGADIIAWKKSTTNISEQSDSFPRGYRERHPYPQA